jgi:hypothetical protein
MTMQARNNGAPQLLIHVAADKHYRDLLTAAAARLSTILLLLLTGVLLAGCASVPNEYPRTGSTALKDDTTTSIGRYVAKAAARHPGESGFAIIRYGRQGLTNRVALWYAPPTAGCGCACCSTT